MIPAPTPTRAADPSTADWVPGDAVEQAVPTTVVMPEMNGRELADRLQARRPGPKRLFVSGYTADLLASRVALEEAGEFLQKPFSRSELARKIRALLD